MEVFVEKEEEEDISRRSAAFPSFALDTRDHICLEMSDSAAEKMVYIYSMSTNDNISPRLLCMYYSSNA